MRAKTMGAAAFGGTVKGPGPHGLPCSPTNSPTSWVCRRGWRDLSAAAISSSIVQSAAGTPVAFPTTGA